MRLCGGNQGLVVTFDGQFVHLAALANFDAEGTDAMRRTFPLRPDRGSVVGRTILTVPSPTFPPYWTTPSMHSANLLR